MERKIKWGVLGLGKIAHKFCSDLQLSDDVELRAVASRDLQKARKFGKKYKAERHYGSYEELVQDPEVEVVYIATPHSYHYEHTMLCLRNNKAVLCEKPMGVNAAQTRAMIDEARSRGLFLMEGLWTRLLPSTMWMLELFEEKEIGDIVNVQADFGIAARYDPKHRLFNKSLGGGSLLDLGIYPLYMSYLALGEPSEVKAMARKAPTGVDNSCNILLRYQNGSLATLSSTLEAETDNEANFHGTKGTMKLHKPFHHANELTVTTAEEEVTTEFPIDGHGYIYEIEEVNYFLFEGLTECAALPLELSLSLSKTMDKVKKEIGLSYET